MDPWQTSIADISDEQLQQALKQAHVPALLASLAHFTGNTDHCEQVKPQYELFGEQEDGLTEAERKKARELAMAALAQYRTRGEAALMDPGEDDITRTMHYITGEDIPEPMLPFLREELNLHNEDRRRVEVDTSNMPADFRVLIIGSGMSGILAAIRLQQCGIPFEILEKNSELSGTWFENTYPGCQVDSSNHLYNYIFEPNTQWPNHFSGRDELHKYFAGVAEKYGLREHLRLNCQVIEARYNEESGRWSVGVEQDGKQQTLEASAVISAVGQLNIPKFPDIEGVGDFAGVSFHSARWEYQHDLTDKKVMVIGTGCSACQLVPEIAPACGELKVFQRSPPWLQYVENYHQPMTPEELWLLRELPFYARWYRFFLFRTRAQEGLLPLLYTDPNWDGPENTISEANELVRAAMTEALAAQAGEDMELLAKVIPQYPPGGKRPVMDDGSWVQTMKRDNVSLLTDSIQRIVPEGIVTADGVLHEADVLIYGTGFKADHFLANMKIYGKNDTELISRWGNNAKAYKGVSVPDFPNFYTIYGPNTNIVVGSSIIFFSECQMRYISGCLKLQIEEGYKSLECRDEVMEAYNEEIDALNAQRAWGAPSVNSWYKNDEGRVTQNWPGTHWEYWLQMREPDPADYLLN